MTAPLLASADIADLCALNDASLPHRATLQRVLRSVRPGGGVRETPEAVRLNVPCRLTRASGGTTRVRGADQTRPAPASWRLVLAAGTPLTGVVRIVVSGVDDAGTAFQRVLRVVTVDTPSVAALRTVWCEVEPDGEG